MRVLFVGNHVKHYVNTNMYREKAILELGHDLVFFEDRAFLLPGRVRQRIDFLRQWDIRRLNSKLLRAAYSTTPDLCIVMGGHSVLPRPKTISLIKRAGVTMVLWTTDAPYYKGVQYTYKTAPLYDHVFCSGTEALEILGERGLKGTTWLPFACDPDYHQPVELTDTETRRYARDVVFVGAFYPNRWEVLRELEGFGLEIWGPNWRLARDYEAKKEYVHEVKLDPSEWVKIYSAAKIVIAIHLDDGKTPCYQASPRVYEALACGCFVLVDRQRDVFALFEDEKHLVAFDSPDDLKRKIAYYLTHPRERRQIAERGRELVLAKHTYRHRIATILETLRQVGLS